jgi:hypothetical protein
MRFYKYAAPTVLDLLRPASRGVKIKTPCWTIFARRNKVGETRFETYKLIFNFMVIIDSTVALDFPASWEQFTEGNRFIFQTSRKEEIIVSVSRISGDGSTTERAQCLDRLFVNGVEAAKRTISTFDLSLVKPFKDEPCCHPYRCSTMLAETKIRDAFFGQAVVQYSHGVIFLTYEAPFCDGAGQAFCDLLKMIHQS